MELYGRTGSVMIPKSDQLRVRTAQTDERQTTVPPQTGVQADPLSYLAAVVRGDIRPSGLSSWRSIL